MSRFGLALLAITFVRFAVSNRPAPGVVKSSALVAEMAKPIATTIGTDAGELSKPDIYLIVLDGHGNARALREALGYDNTPFEDSLRQLGFWIPAVVLSNYTQTHLSLASFLNATHLTSLTDELGENSTDYTITGHLIANNRVARFLQDRGYRYVFFPSAWFKLTQFSPIADSTFDPRPDFNLLDEFRRTELRMAVTSSTLLRYLKQSRVDTMLHVHTLDGMASLAADPRPTFAFAHILLPHIPFFLDGSCKALKNPFLSTLEQDTEEQRRAYVGQMECVDRLVLSTVRRILRESHQQPIIMVLGDHGSRFTDPRYYEHPNQVSPSFVRERFGALGAFLVPQPVAAQLGDSVTLVNVMRDVLVAHFGASIPRSSDEMFVSGEYPFRFYEVRTDSISN